MLLKHHKCVIQIHHHTREDNAVHAVQQAAVPRHETARFFNAGVAFQQGLRKVAYLPEDTDKHAQ